MYINYLYLRVYNENIFETAEKSQKNYPTKPAWMILLLADDLKNYFTYEYLNKFCLIDNLIDIGGAIIRCAVPFEALDYSGVCF